MAEHIQTVIIIFVIGMSVFYVSKRAFVDLISEEDFVLWRNSWAAITLMAFFAGNITIFMSGSAFLAYYVSKKVQDKFAFYLVIFFAFPAYEIYTSIIYITYPSIITMAIVFPMLTSKKWRVGTPALGKPLMDKLIIFLITLTFFLALRGTTPGDSLRASIFYYINWLLPFWFASRSIKDFQQLQKALIALIISASIASIVGLFEYLYSWLLYQPLPNILNFDAIAGGYLSRGDDLRSVASMTHSLTLGFVLTISIGVYFFVSSTLENRFFKLGYFSTLLLGLYSTISRGPWGATGLLVVAFILTGKKAFGKLVLLGVFAGIAFLALPSIPGGQKIINLIPFVGETGQFNVAYRQQLIPKAMEILSRSPLFGVFDASKEPEMQDMVQGEGIVDIVNTYLNIALAYGFVGLTVFVWMQVLVVIKLKRSLRYVKDKNSAEYLCGRSLLSCHIAIPLLLTTMSFDGVLTTFYFVIMGMSFAYCRIMMNKARERRAALGI